MNKKQARLVVEAVLRPMYQRRPFKHDLADMPPDLMAEMVEEMCDAIIAEMANPRAALPPGERRAGLARRKKATRRR